MLPMPVIPDALQTDRKLRSFTMIFFIPVSTGTFLFRKDDLTADLSALRGLLSNCLLLCYRHDGQSYIFPSILKGGNFFPSGSQENHIISQEDKTMKHTDPQPLMTYSQWCTIFKHRLKKYIRRKLYNGLQWLLFILFMVGIPYGMIVHWLFFGY